MKFDVSCIGLGRQGIKHAPYTHSVEKSVTFYWVEFIVDSSDLPAGKLLGFTGIFRLPLQVFVPKLPEFTVP